MSVFTRLIVCVVLLIPAPVFSGIDQHELNQRQRLDQNLRWDNVQGGPLWVDGDMPEANHAWNMHSVRLQQDEKITLRIPTGTELRFVNPSHELRRDMLQISLSDGSGLAVEYLPLQSTNRHSLLVRSNADQPLLVHVTKADTGPTDIEFAVFVSRREDVTQNLSYSEALPLSLERISLRRNKDLIAEDYWRLHPYAATGMDVEGPVRIKLNSHLVYSTLESRLVQDYRMQIKLDGWHSQWIESSTSVATAYPIYVAGKAQLLGRRQADFVDVPEGKHHLSIISDSHLLLRALGRDESDFLLPALNQPDLPVGDLQRYLAGQWGLSIWSLTHQELLQLTAKKDLPLVDRLFVAKRLVRDNFVTDGGLVGTSYLANSVRSQQELSAVRSQARRLKGFRTYYRDLLPEIKPSGRVRERAYFIPRRLQALSEGPSRLTIAEQHLEQWLSRVPLAYFDEVPSGQRSDAYIYHMRPHTTSSVLRLVVDKRGINGLQTFWLQMDDAEPLRVHVIGDTGSSQLEFQTHPGEAALRILQELHENENNPTLNGAFSALRKPAKLIPAGTFKVFLPAATQKVRVWRDPDSEPAIKLALQYRSGKSYKPSESTYLGLLEQVGRKTAYQYFFAALMGYSGDNNIGQRILQNTWLALVTRLRAQSKRYESSVAAWQQPKDGKSIAPGQLARYKRDANSAQKRGDWILALELWGLIVQSSNAVEKETAQLNQADCLWHSGEVYLADRLWRYLSLSEYPEISVFASRKIHEFYIQSQNSEAATMLAAGMFFRRPSDVTLSNLVARFIVDGNYESALLTGLLLPEKQRNSEHILLASYKLGWWQSFNDALDKAPISKRHVWLGLAAQRRGNYASAKAHWREAGPSGKGWLAALDKGLNMSSERAKLGENREELNRLVETWASWNNPGPYNWHEQTLSALEYARVDSLRNTELDRHSMVLHASAQRPVAFKILGPGRIKIRARPLHDKSVSTPLDAWIKIVDNASIRWVPISGNNPVSNRVSLSTAYIPGQAINLVHELTPGLHEISVHMDSGPLAIQLYRWRPEIPLSVFPTAGLSRLDLLVSEPEPLKHEIATFNFLETQSGENRITLHQAHQQDAGGLKTFPTQVLQWAKQSAEVSAFDLLQDKDVTGLLQLDERRDEPIAYDKITALTWVTENESGNRQALLFGAEKIARSFPQSARIQRLWKRISRRSEWTGLTEIVDGPGLEFVEMQGWHPENPYLKKRKALIDEISGDEQVISGNGHLVVSFLNARTSKVRVELKQLMPLFLLPRPMTVLYQLDDGIEQKLNLDSVGQAKRFKLTIPSGEHRLRVSIQQPAVKNQFLSVRITDKTRQTGALAKEYERSFYKTAVSHPLRAHVLGPAWLRIDDWSGTRSHTRYKQIAEGWQIETITPPQGASESLVRLYVRRPSGRPENVAANTIEFIVSAESAIVQVADPPRIDEVRFHDGLSLGAQEAGTYGFRAASVRRNNVDEDNGRSQPEQFIQLDGAYFYSPDYEDFYSETNILARYREHGNPTLGFKQRFDHHTDSWLPNFKLQGDFYIQVPENNVQMSGLLRAAISKKIPLSPYTSIHPSISAFVRFLSLSNQEWTRLNRDARQRVDQDIFTRYKGDHSNGQTLSLALKHRPWLDTLWKLQGSVVSNEDMNLISPDHSSLKLGWKQLLGPVIADVSFRRKFFYRDNDRQRGSERSLAKFNLDWEVWFNNQNRMLFGIQYSRDIERNTDLGFLSLTWFPSEGRGYRDRRPGSVDFRHLLEKRIPQRYNNTIEDVGAY